MNRFLLAAGAAAFLTSAAIAQQSAPPPDQFLKDAIKGDNSEIKLGQLAEARGGTKDVRDFGKMLAKDHKQAGMNARKVAQQMKVKAPSGMTDEAKQELTKLRKLKGAEFDKEFSSYMVQDHQKDIAKFQAEAQDGQDAKVKDLASATLPALRKHLETAQSLQSAAK